MYGETIVMFLRLEFFETVFEFIIIEFAGICLKMVFSITNFLTLMLIHPLFLNTFAQVRYPAVNCPDIFQYSYDRNIGGHYGQISIPRDGSATSELQVNMTMNTRKPVNVSNS